MGAFLRGADDSLKNVQIIAGSREERPHSMKKYIFNRDEFTWAEEFYDIIKKKMELPNYFGCNADALWDMLTGYIDTPCEIVLVGFGKEENVYNRNFLQRIISCFEDAAKEYPEQFKLTKIA